MSEVLSNYQRAKYAMKQNKSSIHQQNDTL